MRKVLAMIVILLLVMFAPCFVKAQDNQKPVYYEDSTAAEGLEFPIFYANGTNITIDEHGDGAIISYEYNNSPYTQIVSKRTTVYGGGQAGTSYKSSSITMNGGTVASIIGGGEGSLTESANVDNVTIKIAGGSIAPVTTATAGTYLKGSLIGGGSLSSTVETVTIEVTGGTIFSLTGGGLASTYYNGVKVGVGTKAHPENSPNITNNAKILLNGGVFNSSIYNYALIYGGGQGHSYVNNTEITITDKADLKKAYLVGGGSNGHTVDSTININGSNIYSVQTINRGSMLNARINMTAGKVAKMYVGAEDKQDFENDIVNGGFLSTGSIVVDITGGQVNSLTLGANYNLAIEKDAKYAKVLYSSGTIDNENELPTTMGTIAKKYATDSKTVEEKVSEAIEVDPSLFTALENTDKVYSIEVGDKYTWTFDGKNIKNPSIAVNTKIELTTEAPSEIREELDVHIDTLKLTDVMFLNFEHDGVLPGKATVSYNIGSSYADGTKLFVLHYNESTNRLESQQQATVTNGIITFNVEECSSYLLSTTPVGEAGISPVDDEDDDGDNKDNVDVVPTSEESNPETSDANIILLFTIVIVSMIGIIIASKKVYKLLK